MSERDDDFEFDFFEEEPATQEATVRRPAVRPRSGDGEPPRRPPVRMRPPQGVTPLLRLIGLIAFAILIVVLLVFWVRSCSESSKHAKYENYMTKVSEIAARSAQIGRQLNDLLTTPDLRQADLQRRLAGFARQEELDVEAAQDINPPGRLRGEHEAVIQALQYRVSGLTGLADSFQRTARTKNLTDAGTVLASQASRLLASDVIWDDSFKDPSKEVLASQDIGDVRVPDSNFLQNVEFASSRSMVAVLQHLRGTTQGVKSGGLHGTNIVSTKALPQGQELNTSQNTVVGTSNLAFEVTIKDSGDSAEVRIPVTLTIQQTPAITQTKTIDFISAGEEKTVRFSGFGAVDFGKQTTLKIVVKAVPNEENTSNNTAEYPVIFSLPG
jgi:hypothetical protein